MKPNGYIERVAMTRAGFINWTCKASLFTAVTTASCIAPALADVTNLDGVRAPIVRISIRRGDVTIRTWDRPSVHVDADSSVAVERKVRQEAGGERSMLIPEAQAKTAGGLVTMPPESFVSASIAAGARDVVSVRSTAGDDVGNVTVTIPADSVFVFAHASQGNLAVHDYSAGTLVGFANAGRLSLARVGGTVFVQTWLGPLLVNGSRFDRLRARSLLGNVVFEHCDVRQIETTAVNGSIVFDAGSFRVGLARFESTNGNVAIGSTAPADLGGRTLGGAVYTNFAPDTPIDARDGQADAVVKGGGPVVEATSETGNVFLYDGSLHERAALPHEWNAPERALQRPAGSRTVFTRAARLRPVLPNAALPLR